MAAPARDDDGRIRVQGRGPLHHTQDPPVPPYAVLSHRAYEPHHRADTLGADPFSELRNLPVGDQRFQALRLDDAQDAPGPSCVDAPYAFVIAPVIDGLPVQ